MSSYIMDHKYGMHTCTSQGEQLWSSNIAILWVFLIKQLFHLPLLDMKFKANSALNVPHWLSTISIINQLSI